MTAVLDAPVDQAVQQLPPALLHPNPFNPRKKLGDLSDLTTTIPDVGILQPLTAVTAEAWNASVDNDDLRVDGGFVLVLGHRRHAAAQKLKLDTVPVLVDDTKIGEAMGGGRVAMLIENLSRVDLDPIDEGESFAQLIELLGTSQRDLAKRLNLDQSYISRAIALTRVSTKVQDAVRKGNLDKAAAVELGKHAADKEISAAAEKELLSATRPGWMDDKRAIEEGKRKVEAARAVKAEIEKWKAKGLTVMTETALKKQLGIKGTDYNWEDRYRLGRSYGALSHVKPGPHEKNDCHRVVVDEGYNGGSPRVLHYCTTPKVHKKAQPKDPEAERRKAEKARAKLFAEATATRRGFLREQWEARGAKLLTKDEFQLAMRDVALTYHHYDADKHWTIAAEIAGMEKPSYYDNRSTQLQELIAAATDVDRYAVLIWLGHRERDLGGTDRPPTLYRSDLEYFTWLERAGYAPTEIEGELITASPDSLQTTVEEQVAEATGAPAKPAKKRPVKKAVPAPAHPRAEAAEPEPGAPFEIGSLVIEAAEVDEPEPPAGLVIAVEGLDVRVAWSSSSPTATEPIICDYQAGELLPAPENAKRPDVIVEDAPDA